MVKKTLSKKQLDSLAKGREIRANNIRLKNSSINQSGGGGAGVVEVARGEARDVVSARRRRLIDISNAIASLVKLNLAPSRVQNVLQPIIWNAMTDLYTGNLNRAYGDLSDAVSRFS
jgi:hypothetical protein